MIFDTHRQVKRLTAVGMAPRLNAGLTRVLAGFFSIRYHPESGRPGPSRERNSHDRLEDVR